MNTYIFVRHSEPDINLEINPSEWELSKKGIQLVEDIVNYGLSHKIDHIYSSTELKAIQTAEVFSEKFEIPINQSDKLIEVKMDKYLPQKEWLEYKEKAFRDIHFSGKNAESHLHALSRITSEIKDLDGKYKNKNILIVAHGTILTTYFASVTGILGQGMEVFEKWKSIAYCQMGILYNNKIVKQFLDSNITNNL